MTGENSHRQPDNSEAPQSIESTTRFERYELTGNRISRWTVAARQTLMETIRRLFWAGRSAGNVQLPGHETTIGDAAKQLPAKGVDFLEAQIEKSPIENQLKSAQTQTEFLKQELLREQISNLREDTREKKSTNLERELSIQKRILELTNNRSRIHVITDGERELVVIGKLPQHVSDNPRRQLPEITALGLSKRVLNCLSKVGITTSIDLIQLDRSSLLGIHGIGKVALHDIEDALLAVGAALHSDSS